MSDNRADGSYTRKKGLHRKYEYTASWGDEEQGVGWHAKVRFEGELKGTLNGILLNSQIPPRDMVIAMVEASIENLVQMIE